jgi:peptidoglycan/xylan/chitin deacetylase (PgdA/CDA1 family)
MLREMENTSVNKNTVVLLMHDLSDKQKTADMLQKVIDYYKNNGYVFENFYSIFEYDEY